MTETRLSAPATELSRREKEVAGLMVTNMSMKQIAHEMGLTDASIRVYALRVYRKLGVQCRVEYMARRIKELSGGAQIDALTQQVAEARRAEEYWKGKASEKPNNLAVGRL